ncbi:MAG: single-stranded DNA-binding protein [Acidobacteria bacterium]|nr:single-stranded DNA-binding protein [Acidobacteriota bacterium]
MSFNKIIIVGNLGRDPELKYTPQGQQVCEFSVATNEKRKDNNGEMKDETTWFRVSFWGKLAEVASKYLAKGRQVYIEGRLRAREWTDKEGKTHTSLEVFGSELKLLGSRGEDSMASAAVSNATTTNRSTPKSSAPVNDYDDNVTEDDIPF